jgi:hypothetical protein
MPTFQQSFRTDFEAVVAGLLPGYGGPPYAFARWADGEAAIAFGREHAAKSDGWSWPAGKRTLLSESLIDALAYDAEGWHVGITAEEHHAGEHAELLRYVAVPPERVTFAEIFIFANFARWQQLDLSHCLAVGCGPDADFRIPADAIGEDWLWHGLADELIEAGAQQRRPILVAAGPVANVLIYEYWRRSARRAKDRQVILDVGSVLAERMQGRRTRVYHRANAWQARWEPKWKVLRTAPEQAAAPPAV